MGVLESVQGMRVDMLGKPRAKKKQVNCEGVSHQTIQEGRRFARRQSRRVRERFD